MGVRTFLGGGGGGAGTGGVAETTVAVTIVAGGGGAAGLGAATSGGGATGVGAAGGGSGARGAGLPVRGQFLTDLKHGEVDILAWLGLGEQVDILLVICERFLLLAELLVFEVGEVQIGRGETRFGRDALLEPMFGPDEIVFASGDDAEAVECLGRIRVARQMMFEGFLGLTPRGDAHVGEAELVVGIGRGGAVLDDLSKVGDGVRSLTPLELREGEIVTGGDVIGVKADRVLKVSESGVGLALLEAAHAEEIEGERVGLHGRESALEVGRRFVVFAVLVFGEAPGKLVFTRGFAAAANGQRGEQREPEKSPPH